MTPIQQGVATTC